MHTDERMLAATLARRFLLSLIMNLAEQHDWRFLLCAFEHSGGGLLKQLQEKRLRKHFMEMTDEEADEAVQPSASPSLGA